MSTEDAKTERIIKLLDEVWSLKCKCRTWKACFCIAAVTALFMILMYLFALRLVQ